MIELEPNQILQINATVITGYVIFLSLLSVINPFTGFISTGLFTIPRIGAVIIIAIFARSCVYILDQDNKKATSYMRWGFNSIFIYALIYLALLLIRPTGLDINLNEYFKI